MPMNAAPLQVAPAKAAGTSVAHGVLQRKLMVGATSDPLEQQADRAADLALVAAPRAATARTVPHIQRMASQPAAGVGTAPMSVNHALAQSGRPLESSLRQDMEHRLGHDFSRVRIHTGPAAESSAREVSARAYTVGQSVVFNTSQFEPQSLSGRRLIAHELTHVVQQDGGARRVQRTPSPAAEGAAQAGEQNPTWQFGRTMEGRGFQMNPALWLVTYHLRSSPGTIAITNGSGRTALENVQRHLASHPTWRNDATIERIEVTLVPKASAAAAAQDLMSSTAKKRYSFECFTAAALIQFVGVFRSLQAADPATAVAKFDRSHSDISVTIPFSGNPGVRMGGSALVFNMASLPDFSLRKLLDSSTDMGLQRGDWVFLDNKKFITSGAFQGENATYLGKKRFFGHGMGVFTVKEYAQRLRRDHRVKLTEDQILDQVRVGPRFRAPDPAATASGSTPPTSSGSTPPTSP